MTAPVFSVDDFLAGLQGLMPRGPIWQSDPNSVQGQLERGLVTSWARLNAADAQLLADAFPATAEFLLPEWEAALGLPDPCAGPAPTIEQRRQQVVARLTDKGGLSSARFIALAQRLGYTVTTEMFAPFRAGQSHAGDPLGGPWSLFTWQVDGPLVTPTYFRAGSGHAGEPLRSWGNAVLECEISAFAPAHTVVKFAYGYDLPEGFGVDFATDVYYVRPIGGAPKVDTFTSLWTFARASTGTYLGVDGLLKTAAINAPRIEYSTTGTLLGLLMEGSRTNYFLRSAEHDNAAWSLFSATVTPNTTIAPDGTLSGDRLVEAAANAQHSIKQQSSGAFPAGSNVVYSAWVKYAGRNRCYLQAANPGYGAGMRINFRFDTQAISGLTFGGAVINQTRVDAYPNGWYRLQVAGVIDGVSTSSACNVFMVNDAGLDLYLGDGVTGLDLWGEQFEVGTFASSYIPTAAAAVTRAGETCTRALGTEYSASAGTIVIEFDSAADPSTVVVPAQLDDGTSSNRTLIYASTGSAVHSTIVAATVAQSDIPVGALTASVPIKAATAWAANSHQIAVAGVLGVEDTSVTLPTLTTADLGHQASGGAALFGHVKKLTYFPVRKSNAELQALTA